MTDAEGLLWARLGSALDQTTQRRLPDRIRFAIEAIGLPLPVLAYVAANPEIVTALAEGRMVARDWRTLEELRAIVADTENWATCKNPDPPFPRPLLGRCRTALALPIPDAEEVYRAMLQPAPLLYVNSAPISEPQEPKNE